jgi:nucleoside-diphosphate-sugar epimerase
METGYHSNAISLSFQTSATTGAMLYLQAEGTASDFLSVAIRNSVVVVYLNTGNQTQTIVTSTTVADGAWHTLEVERSQTEIEVVVDGRSTTVGVQVGQANSRVKMFGCLDGENRFVRPTP